MPNPKPLDTIHDLFASPKRESDASSDSSTHFQGDVYEQLAQLEYIYVDKTVRLMSDDNRDTILGKPISIVDFFEGLAQLATMGVVEVTDIVEAIHREIILRPLGRFNEKNLTKWQRGITGRIYGTVRNVMFLVGNNLASGLHLYNNMRNQKHTQPLPKNLKRLVNILNGVMGDHLINHDNPLAVSMVLYNRRCHLQHDELSGRIIILCHGLCMSHLSWYPSESDSLGARIIHSRPTSTVLYLNYNTGRRISINGHDFSKVLQDLVDNNPDISQIDLVGHSMGGLVARSALFYGKQQGFNWMKRVGNLVTLGSPHHGASLERIGNFVQDRIAKLPFAGSLAKLGDLRSAGIIDLRYGSIRDADWQALEGRSVLPAEFRHPTRLPLHVRAYFVAATLVEAHYDSKATSLLGDGLVTIESALGEHAGEHTLSVPEGHKAIFYGVSHYKLLYNDRVQQQVVAWLLCNGRSDAGYGDYEFGPRIHSYPNNLEVTI
ncbi:esterase/lipase family protein [Psychrobacter urativorans]|uniref:esterase/lipase family protein n=1 Tax=Psychrobacter urativorans TaxID=45610 RepID=UPI00191A9CAA|nr:alpha/beta fold hydrolase [Psychrobacter urativorans]